MKTANENWSAMRNNYRVMYASRIGQSWVGTDLELDTIIKDSLKLSSPTIDEVVINDMKEKDLPRVNQ